MEPTIVVISLREMKLRRESHADWQIRLDLTPAFHLAERDDYNRAEPDAYRLAVEFKNRRSTIR
jgi:hypothetical protein